MSQLTEGKCLRCASFLSRPQNTCTHTARLTPAHWHTGLAVSSMITIHTESSSGANLMS